MRIVLLLLFLSQGVLGTLKFVQIWFRHGERLPGNDLHFAGEDVTDLDYLQLAYPGELTKNGINQEFELGKRLRKLYGYHFGDTYRPTEFHVYTGKDNRTSTSAQAMFAGFFPPNKDQLWNSDLNWQPIAQETDVSIDWVSLGAIDRCRVYGEQFSKSAEYAAVMDELTKLDPELFELVRNHSIEPITNALTYNHAIDSLKIRTILKDNRLPVPKWAIGYEKRILYMAYAIHDAIVKSQNSTIGNYHVELVMSYFETHFQSNTTKGVFVSGHDTSLVAVWEAFNLKNRPDDIPNFGSHIAIELHENLGVFSVKFFLSMGFNQTRIELTPELCGNIPCSWNTLKEITANSRKNRPEWAYECQGVERSGEVSTVTGSMIVLLSILLLSTIILGFTTFSYKRQLNHLRDPERARLL